jgi:hypothetical protein
MTDFQRHVLKLGQRGLTVAVLAITMAVAQAINLLVTRVAGLSAFEAGVVVVGVATLGIGIPIVTLLSRLVFDLDRARADVKTLKGIVPICSACKAIRNSEGSWSQLESHLTENTEASFTHGICPECMRRLYPEPVCESVVMPMTAIGMNRPARLPPK